MSESNIPPFETSMKQLETIVSQLEKGELSIEQQLAIFEKGIKMSRDCLKQLDEIEKKVEILMANGSEIIGTKEFNSEGS